MAQMACLPFPHAMPEMSPEEEEEKRKRNLKIRAALIRKKLSLRERAAKDAGLEFNRNDHKINSYDWLLIPPRELQNYYMFMGSPCNPTKATTAEKEARVDVNSKDSCGFTCFQDDDDGDDEANEEEGGGLSKSGKELKNLLGRATGMNDSDADDNDDEADDDMSMSPVLAPKKKDTTSKSTKSKRKASEDDAKVANSAPLEKVKMEIDLKSSAKGKNAIPSSGSASLSSKAPAHPSAGPVTEEEIRAVLLENAPLTTAGLVLVFCGRLKSEEDKKAFVANLGRIAKIQKSDGANYVVLRDPSTGPIAEEEIRAILSESAPLTVQGLGAKFRERLKSKEDINAFAAILMRISKIQKVDKAKYLVLRDNDAITSADPSTCCVTEEEIRAFLVQSAPLTAQELVAKFKGRLNLKEDKDAFLAILSRTVKSQKIDGADYVVLKDQ